LNSQPGLLSYLLKRATSPMKFGDHTTPVFADALDNIFRAVLDDSVQKNPLNTPMQDALLAQRKFSAKKSLRGVRMVISRRLLCVLVISISMFL
jgi:hypothetical protein